MKTFEQLVSSTPNKTIVRNRILNAVLLNREVGSAREVDYPLSNLAPPTGLPGIEKAAERLANAVINKERIAVFGDYDVDGCTSICVLVKGLKLFGVSAKVRYVVPDRAAHGYGLTNKAIDELVANHPTDLLVTVDCGITSVKEVDILNALKIDTIITDHHLPRDDKVVPSAISIVNPRLDNYSGPLLNLAGCGVAFYLIATTRRKLAEQDYFEETTPNLGELLDIVALGTIADMVTLDYNNRVIVKNGMEVIRQTGGCTGLKALLDIASIDHRECQTDDLSFKVAPALNAAGRLENMKSGIMMLLEEDYSSATALASGLYEVNSERKRIEASMQIEADSKIEVSGNTRGLVAYSPEYHEGVVGIVAGRLKEKHNIPVVCFAKGEGDTLKGSARGVPGLHLKHELFDVINQKHPGLIERYGGHAFALGLALKSNRLSEFEVVFSKVLEDIVSRKSIGGSAWYDIEPQPEELTPQLAKEIDELGPWGNGFEKPKFYSQLQVIASSTIGDGRHFKATARIGGSSKVFNVVAFSCLGKNEKPPLGIIEATYQVTVNKFNGRESLQLIIEKYKQENNGTISNKKEN